MQMTGGILTYKSLARGYARQTLEIASQQSADAAKILNQLHDLAPNKKNRGRTVARLRKHRGVISAVTSTGGVRMVLRSTLDVTVCGDEVGAYTEPRISWMQVYARSGRGNVGFNLACIQVSLHAIQRRLERSDLDRNDALARLDHSMMRAFKWLEAHDPLDDSRGEYLPMQHGVWAGRTEQTSIDQNWGAAFRNAASPLRLFSIRTYLSEDEMRPLVWLDWSRTSNARLAA